MQCRKYHPCWALLSDHYVFLHLCFNEAIAPTHASLIHGVENPSTADPIAQFTCHNANFPVQLPSLRDPMPLSQVKNPVLSHNLQNPNVRSRTPFYCFPTWRVEIILCNAKKDFGLINMCLIDVAHASRENDTDTHPGRHTARSRSTS